MNAKIDFPLTIRVGILVYDGFEPIDVWGFTEAFAISRFIGTAYQSPPPYPFEILFISNEVRPSGKPHEVPAPVKSANGPRVAPDMFRDDALKQPFDLLMIPGGNTGPLLDQSDPKAVKALVAWVKAMDKRVKLMTSVCTGAAVLAHAGVLDGQARRDKSRGVRLGDAVRPARVVGQRFALGRCRPLRHLRRCLVRHRHGVSSC